MLGYIRTKEVSTLFYKMLGVRLGWGYTSHQGIVPVSMAFTIRTIPTMTIKRHKVGQGLFRVAQTYQN